MVGKRTSVPVQTEVEELLQFLYLMPVAVVKLGLTGEVKMLNPKAVDLLHALSIDPGHADGLSILDGLLPGLAAQWQASAGKVGAIVPPQRCNPLHRPAVPLHLVLQLVRPDAYCTMLAIEDVTATVEQERELARQRSRMGVVLDHIHGYCVAMLDLGGTITEWNPSIGTLFGVTQGVGVGEPLLNWLARDVAQTPPADFATIKAAVVRQGWYRLQAPWRKVDGEVLWGDCVITAVLEDDGVAGSFNDTHGHDAGDGVLRAVAHTLQNTARKGDILARTGGEEFVLLLPDVAAAPAVLLAERLRLRVEALSVSVAGCDVRVTMSLGVAQQGSGEAWIAALARADAALYLAKQEGRNRSILSAADLAVP